MSSNDGGRPPLRIVPQSAPDEGLPDDGGTPPDSALLIRLAATRAAGRPFYLAAMLERYRRDTDQDEEQLAAMLGCSREALPKLALCRAPDADAVGFRQEIELIAAFAGVRASALAQIIRHVGALEALREPLPDTDGLLAARDRGDDESTPSGPGEPR